MFDVTLGICFDFDLILIRGDKKFKVRLQNYFYLFIVSKSF